MDNQGVFVEIVAKKKGCMLCDLAIGILEEIAPEFDDGMLRWDVVDVGRMGMFNFGWQKAPIRSSDLLLSYTRIDRLTNPRNAPL